MNRYLWTLDNKTVTETDRIMINRGENLRLILIVVLGGFMCLVIGKALNEYFTVGTSYEIIYALVFNSPFIIGLVCGFWKFRIMQSNS